MSVLLSHNRDLLVAKFFFWLTEPRRYGDELEHTDGGGVGGGVVASVHWVGGRVRCRPVSGCNRSRDFAASAGSTVQGRSVRMLM